MRWQQCGHERTFGTAGRGGRHSGAWRSRLPGRTVPRAGPEDARSPPGQAGRTLLSWRHALPHRPVAPDGPIWGAVPGLRRRAARDHLPACCRSSDQVSAAGGRGRAAVSGASTSAVMLPRSRSLRARLRVRAAARCSAWFADPLRHRPGHHGGDLDLVGVAHSRTCVAPSAGHHVDDPADLRGEPTRAPHVAGTA